LVLEGMHEIATGADVHTCHRAHGPDR
jgi:hypothetical protein